MRLNKKVYAFTSSMVEDKATIPTLWTTTQGTRFFSFFNCTAYTKTKNCVEFMKENPHLVAEDNLVEFLGAEKDGSGDYGGCHFWSNFEIVDLRFYRSEAYTRYFQHLDKAGGFYYERWGDAPVHTIAASLLVNRHQIHFFNNIAYTHDELTHCPANRDTRVRLRCACDPNDTLESHQ
jgi:alpha 1,2-mannosyltransferase